MQNKKSRVVILIVSFVSSLVSSLSFCGNNNVSAYSVSMTTNNAVVVDASPSGSGVSIHGEAINVVSDCRNGYNLSIATSGSSNLYAGGDSTNPATFTAVDGTSAISSSNNTNKWGYTMTANPTTSTVFSPLSTTVATLKTSSQTASPSSDIDDTFNINYGVKVDTSVAPGSYGLANNGAIVYYLTMDTTCTQYTVAFNANGGSGTMTSQTLQEGESANLTAKAFTAPTGASYTDANNDTINGDADKLWAFWGWNTEADGTGDWYKDKEAVTSLANAGSTVTLYAQWKQATLADMTAGTPTGTEKVIDHNLMQDMLPEACYNSPITTAANAPAATLLDYRGKVTTGENPEQPEQYNVSKLADGLCWMTTNLNLGRSTGGPNGNGTITLTPDDTDITSNFTLPAGTTTSSTTTTAARIRITNNSGTNANGVYYSWAAAVASTTSTSTNPTTSVCPKGWDLPTNTQFTNLSSKSSYSSSNPPTAAPSSFLNGKFTNGATFYPSSYNYGFYWSSTSSSTTAAYGARTTASALSTASSTGPTYGGNKYYEKNLRCIASQGTVTVNYDGNGTNEYPVTGTTASQEAEINVGINARTNGFTREGWVFDSWNTEPDGSGTSIAADATIPATLYKPNTNITLYAQWSPAYTITYVNNCRSYTSVSSCTQTVSNRTNKQDIPLDASGNGSGTLGAYNYNSWTITNWKIAGWNTAANGSGTEYRASDTYSITGQGAGSGITLYAHWVPLYSIQYDGNGASNSNGMGSTDANGAKSVKQINVGESNLIDLLPSNFKRAGHSFVGWSTDPDAWTHFTDNDPNNDSRIYGPMETIEAPAYPSNTNGILTFYAVWAPAETSGGNPVYLQDFGSTKCANLTSAIFDSTTGYIIPGSVIALTDKRDNQVYTIAKLADGKCWMVENLRLDNQYTVGNNINDSSITNESLSEGYGGVPGTYGSFVGLADSENVFSTSNTASNSIYKSDGSGDIFNSSLGTLEDIGTSGYAVWRFPRYNNDNTNNLVDSPTYTQDYIDASNPTNSGTNYRTSSNIYSYGNSYSFAAAIANTNYFSSANPTSETAGTSICPSGWTLPTNGDATKDFRLLSRSYGGADAAYQLGVANGGDIMSRRFRTFPNNFIYSGYNGQYGRGSYGRYMSKSIYTSSLDPSVPSLEISPTNFYAVVNYAQDAYSGKSVRCLVAGS